jgi:hypothetical protein
MRSERGVTMVEAAFVTPIFLFFIMAIIEGGLYMNDYLALSSSTRAGVRASSALGAVGRADMYTLIDIDREASALRDDQIEYVVIYKASGFGADPTDACKNGASVANVCNVYRREDIDKAWAQLEEESAQEAAIAANQTRTLDTSKQWFGCLITGPNAGNSPDRHWCPGDRVDARSGNSNSGPDYVGVYIKAEHPWVAKIFGDQTTLTEKSVIQIEPRTE